MATSTAQHDATQTNRIRFTVGSFRVHVDCVLPDAVDDLKHLYRNHLLSNDDTDACDVHVRVIEEPYSVPMRRRYSIQTGEESLSNNRQAREVLPYLEWGINSSIIRTQHRFLQLHAATLSLNGQGVIIAAKSGSGKSTLAAALLSRGWQYLSDEFALIDPTTLNLHPFPKALCIKSGSFKIVRQLGLPLWTRRHYAKAYKGQVGYVSPDEVRANAISDICPVKAILFPQYMAATEPSAIEIPRGEAAIELGGLSFNRTKHGVDAMSTLANLLEKTQCWRIHSGDAIKTCELIESLM